MKQSQTEKSKFQSIYEAMPKEMQMKMDSKMELLKEKSKTNPTIEKMLKINNQNQNKPNQM